LVQLLVAVVLVAAIAGAAGYFIFGTWQSAERRLQNAQEWTDQSGRYAVIIASNYAVQARLAQIQAVNASSQANNDREAVLALRFETVHSLTNAAYDLIRRLSRQLNDQGQSNMMAMDLNYAARLQGIEKQMETERQKLMQTTLEQLKTLNKELTKYDPLLKIDPDVAGRIDTALKQLKTLVDITELLKLRQENDLKNLNNQLAIMTEKLKVLDLRLSQVQISVSAATNPPITPLPAGGPKP
jgi:hypothetical protein